MVSQTICALHEAEQENERVSTEKVSYQFSKLTAKNNNRILAGAVLKAPGRRLLTGLTEKYSGWSSR